MQRTFSSLGWHHCSELCPAPQPLEPGARSPPQLPPWPRCCLLCWAGPVKEGAAATCLGETQEISGWVTGKVKQTIRFQAEWSDVRLSV